MERSREDWEWRVFESGCWGLPLRGDGGKEKGVEVGRVYEGEVRRGVLALALGLKESE